MPAHLPNVYAFWSTVVFQTESYRGRPLDEHLRLPALPPEHRGRWLNRLETTVDAHFAGPAPTGARQMSGMFQVKLGLDSLAILAQEEPTSTTPGAA